MAAVYAATHRNGSRAAVKLLHAELSINPQVRTRFLREGYVANTVGHDGAVKVIDDDVAEDGSLFLVSELLDGETLEERCVRFGGRLSEDDVLSVTDQLLDVLVAAHAKGVIHRDLKPENVFLTRTGVVKVLDFGIARLRELSTASTATRAGTSMGTPAYMPPEQARGLWDEVDGRGDLWAVGATMFRLLAGQMVHEGRTSNEQLLSAMTKQAPPLASVLPSTGANVTHVVDRALAFERDKRWSDARRMQEAVRHAYHDRHGSPISTAPRLTVPETVPNRTLPSAQGAMGQRLLTTGEPVARQPSGSATPSAPVRRRVAVLALAAILGITVATIAATVFLRHQAPGTAASALASATMRTVPTEAVSAPAPASQVPPAALEIAATDAAAPTATTEPVEASKTTQAARSPTPAIAPPAPVATSKPSGIAETLPSASAQPLPQIPSVSAFQQGLAVSVPQARACLGANDAAWRATLLFQSDGTVLHVEAIASIVTPDCSDNACLQQKAACIRTALAKTRVPPFTQPTFSVSATVRPN